MCGILGVRRSWLDDPQRIQAACEAMTWRGPNRHDRIVAGDWHLAVARLTISDSRAPQPIWTADRRRVILFNGVVTSANTERTEIGTRCVTGNDAELPLHRLARGGPEGLLQTSGHYAMAILEPATDQLWLARDPEGEKPLYVVRRGRRVVAFASTIASLRHLGLSITADDGERARFLRFGFALGQTVADGELTLDQDLRGVVLHRGDAVPREWSPRPSAAPGSLFDRVRRATDRCAQAEVPVGLCLSGGVDSSCLAAALHLSNRQLPAYQFRADRACSKERDNARRVADHTGMELRLVDGGPQILEWLPELTRMVGQPLGDPSVLAVHAVARTAAADGIRVLLSGEGADELFMGYRRHRVARHLTNPLPLGPLGMDRALGMSTVARLCRAAASRQPYESLLEVTSPAFRRAVFAPELVESNLPVVPSPTPLHRARDLDRHWYLRRDLLPKLDTALMAAGVEGRCPYLDPEVVHGPESSAEDPRTLLGKSHLRAAFREHLPERVLRMGKRGFGLPLDRWLREHDMIPDLLRDPRTVQRSHLRGTGLTRLLDLHLSGRYDLGHPLFLVASLEYHLRDVEAAA